MFGLFAGLNGAISWLAEVDQISDDLLDPNDDQSEDRQVRNSLVWEFTPMQFLQARIGLRSYVGIPQVDTQNRDVFFAEIHAFF